MRVLGAVMGPLQLVCLTETRLKCTCLLKVKEQHAGPHMLVSVCVRAMEKYCACQYETCVSLWYWFIHEGPCDQWLLVNPSIWSGQKVKNVPPSWSESWFES